MIRISWTMSKLLAKQFPSLTGDWKGIPKIIGFLQLTGPLSKTIGSIFSCFSAWLIRIVRTTHDHIRTGSPVPSNLARVSAKDLVQCWWCPQNLWRSLAIVLHLHWIVTSLHNSRPVIRCPYSPTYQADTALLLMSANMSRENTKSAVGLLRSWRWRKNYWQIDELSVSLLSVPHGY